MQNVLSIVKTNVNEMYVKEFLLYMRSDKGARPKTLIGYETDLRRFISHFSTRDVLELRQQDLREYKFSLVDAGLAPRTVNRAISVIRSFYEYFVDHDDYDLTKNPAKHIQGMKVPRTMPITLGEQQAKTLLDGIMLTGRYAVRDYAIFATFLYTGMRVSELISLKTYDVNFEDNYIHVRDGKGGKDRLIPMIPQLSNALQIYLQTGIVYEEASKNASRSTVNRYKCGRSYFVHGPDDHTLFLTQEGKQYSRKGIDWLFKGYTKRLGIYKEGLSLHALRRSCLTYLHKQGVDLFILKEISGHARVQTLEHYLAIDNSKVLDAMKAHPLHNHHIDRGLVEMVRGSR
ncbi:tyrosine-type recombinase/integrase [Brevibacillus borstelensis]|uniref:tyrosine-type recombinase/integrase n=1 Tax=Brevibacillus borstelensis TaxID=45462 RepID=UPI002E20DF42|nr:tyrosine-type recombinase/integrase [Brevibacillus borstelensis]MED1850369.1 tyrosine-type recombinase/integrase [Brevibacillus borstelensis]